MMDGPVAFYVLLFLVYYVLNINVLQGNEC